MATRASQRRRWKKIEEKVAKILSEIFSDVGKEPVARIPILGRTGPDISYNDIKLIIDVKSRQEVPKSSIAQTGELLNFGKMVGFPLKETLNIADLSPTKATPSKLVTEWLSHMNEWTQEHEPEGISCVILHRPGMPVGNSTVIIYTQERNTLCQKIQSSLPMTAMKL